MACVGTALAPTRRRTGCSSKQKKWTNEEDALLNSLVMNKPVDKGNWKFIAEHFPDKTTQQVFERWTKVLDPTLLKGSWSREEDETIISFVRQYGTKNWTRLSEKLPGRIGKQCRERWFNHLNPDISHEPWSDEEDRRLFYLHQQFGNKWAQISALMPNRPDNAIKNRWYSTVCKLNVTKSSPPVVQKTAHFENPDPKQVLFPVPDELSVTPLPKIISPMMSTGSPFVFSSPSAPWKLLSQPTASPLDKTTYPSPSLKQNRAELLSMLSSQ